MFGFRKKLFSGFGQITFLIAGVLTIITALLFFGFQFFDSGWLDKKIGLIKEEKDLETTPAVSVANSEKFLAKIFSPSKTLPGQSKIAFDSEKPILGSDLASPSLLPTGFFESKTKETQEETESGPLQKLVISEILFDTEASSKQEFVELFNPNDFPLDLSGWELRKKTETGNDSVLVSSQKFFGTINPNSYFLISHPDFAESFKADLSWSSKGYSISENNAIYLFDAFSRQIDLVGCGSAFDYENAVCQVPEKGISISRSQNLDSDNNQKDFAFSQPSPGQNFIAYAPLPSPAISPVSSYIPPGLSPHPSPETTEGVATPSPSLVLSPEPTPSPQTLSHPEIIEVQFGIEGNANADFVKMFNANDAALDLKDYKLYKKTASSGNETSLKSWRNDGEAGIIPGQSYFYWVNSGYQEKIDDLSSQGIKFFMTSGTITDTNGIGLKFQEQLVSSQNW